MKEVLRLVRERDLCGDSKASPPVPRMLPFSRATLWRKVKEGDFPAPVRISAGITAWRMEQIEVWLNSRQVGTSEPARLKNSRIAA